MFKCHKRGSKWIPTSYDFRTFAMVHFGIQAAQVNKVTDARHRRLSKMIVHEKYDVNGRP